MQDILKSGVSRRTVVKGAAWSVPAIAVAGAAPAYAATPIVVVSVGTACKHPGESTEFGKEYHFELIFTNNGGDPTQVKIDSVVLEPTSGQDVTFSTINSGTIYNVGPHSKFSVIVHSDPTGNSATGTLVVTYEYLLSDGTWSTVETAINVTQLPPCNTIGVFN